MRIALVSPYSWTYPGGVTRHIEALADELAAIGHEPRILTPFDPDDRLSVRLHRGARPQAREQSANVVSLGRTVGLRANGAVSNVALAPSAVVRMRQELRAGDYDVVHVHEPIVPVVGWDAVRSSGLPTVGTFHTYSTNRLTNNLGNLAGARRRFNSLHVRIAVSRAAAWTGERFFGGHYRVIPNGVAVPDRISRAAAGMPSAQQPLRLAFVGQAVARKGLPVALRAFEALREHVPVSFDVIGVEHAELEMMLADLQGVNALGKVGDAEKIAVLGAADLLVAPALGGESFGMVLTEAFAVGTPVVASDIAGYNDVVRDGLDGVLFGRGDATALAQTLLELAFDVPRRQAMSLAAAEHAHDYAWPLVAAEVLNAYEDAIAIPEPRGAIMRAAVRIGARGADLAERRPAQRRLPSLERDERTRRQRALTGLRRALFAMVGAAGVAAAVLAVEQIGPGRIARALVTSQPSWVIFGLALMCAAMAARGIAWHAILRAALPGSRVRRADAMQGTFIGVLMSATLPARLGEPSRSLIVARRVGRPAETFPIVLGTIVSQTLLNLLALAGLGAVMFTSVDLFNGRHTALIAVAVGPAVLAGLILAAPLIVGRRGGPSRSMRLDAFRAQLRLVLIRLRAGMRVFREPRLGAIAVSAQLGAWMLQCASCYVLLIALGLDHRAGLAAAAGVLFAVNVTAVLPAAPSNVGVFQAACVAVLAGAFHVSTAEAIAYGIVLQAIEVTTAVVMGIPALLREGMSWRDVKLRAMHTAPVTLQAPEVRSTGGAASIV
ncbi:MAG TPA: lysylphosphatidylglycerol synthase domain-containing protein [Solirubrobacteraceae bacterium]|nr:lysylphosphatidylglycerol synthase domain-containing protein [Solirubrobacteraceae bacterium]